SAGLIEQVAEKDKPALWGLLQDYLRELSAIDGTKPGRSGEFDYRYFDRYWIEPDRVPLALLHAGDRIGFALVRLGQPNEMAEFYVQPAHRRRGIGRAFARECFRRFPGRWRVHQMPRNSSGTAFWRATIPFAFEETEDSQGTTQVFVATPYRP